MSEKKSPDASRRFPKVALFVVLGFLLVGLVWAMRFSERPVGLIPVDQATNQGRITPTPSPSTSPVSQENAWQLEPNTLLGGWQRVSPNYWGELRALATAGRTLYTVGTGSVLVHDDDGSERAWQRVRSTSGNFWGAGLISADEGWLIGEFGWSLHFKGNTRDRVNVPTKEHL